MAISKNLLMTGVSGSINKEVVFRQFANKTVISAYPDMSNRKLSPKQKRINELMAESNLQWRAIKNDEQKRNAALLRLNVTRNKLYTALISEYFENALKKENV
jgi:hypothetical protein